MASVAFDLFLPEVLPECPGVPEPVAINAIRNACFDFCATSLIWNEFQDPEAYSAGEAEYQVIAPAGAQVIRVLNILLDDGRTIAPIEEDAVTGIRPQWRTATGVIEGYVCSSPDVFRFVAVPDSAGTYTASVAYAPLRSASSIDASIYNYYLETIKYGALGRLMAMATTTWYEPNLAVQFKRLFDIGTGKATTDRNRSNSRASMRVAPRPFV